MDAFSYLSVMIAVILGLAITQVLQGYRGLLHARKRVQLYWPTLVWSVLVLMIAVQTWWAMFVLRSYGGWNFLAFAVVLMETIAVYMVAALVLPDFSEERTVDLKQRYFEHARWFYGLLVAAILMSFAKELVLYGRLPQGLNLVFQLVFMAGTLAMALTRNETFHKLNTLVSLGLFLAYIASLFEQLH